MTFQPPPGETPPPPPPPSGGQWGPPPGGVPGRPGFDPKTINPLDWGIVGAGVLAFISSFISFYTADVDLSGNCPGTVSSLASANTESASAWHEVFGGGFFAWFAMLFAIAGAAITAGALFGSQVKLPVPARLGGLGLFAAATLFELIAIFVSPGDTYKQSFNGCTIEAGIGHGFGFWASLIVIIAGLVLSLMRFQQTGGTLPGGMNDKVPNIGGYGPQGGISGTGGPSGPQPGTGDAPPPPPPPGYGPPAGQ